MAVQRGGFKDGTHAKSNKPSDLGTVYDDQLKGDNNGNTIDGLAGDDVIIGYAGNDVLEGGDGKDDLSGSTGDDSLIGGLWDNDGDGIQIGTWVYDVENLTWTFNREFFQDDDADDFVAAGSFAQNGTDTIYGYDESIDVVEVNALQGAYDTLDFADDATMNDSVTAGALEDAGYARYDADTGALMIDLDGGGDNLDVWFVVKEDSSTTADGTPVTSDPGADPSWDNAESVTLEIAGQQLTFYDYVV